MAGELIDVAEPRILDRRFRLPVIGIVVVVTVVALEAMAVTTIMPTVVRALHGVRYYSWGFTAYLLADVVGMVDAGRRTDHYGPAQPLLGGMVLFAGGLVAASVAGDIWVFLAARVLQGLGGGSIIVALYVVIARTLPQSLHGRAFALTSAAWVVPSLVGPGLAGVVASTIGWRWVFGGIAPIALAGALTLIPCLRSLSRDEVVDERPHRPSWVVGVQLAIGLGAIQEAAQLANRWSIAIALAGVALCVVPLHRLMPTDAFRLGRGLPTVVALRGFVTCAFFGAEAYLPLTLTRLHDGTPRTVGIPLTIASLGWSAGSWMQGRRRTGRVRSMQVGFVLVAAGVALLVLVTRSWSSLWLAIPIWTVAGAGIGLVMPLVSVLLLELSPESDQGANSAAVQLADMTGTIIGISVIAVLVNDLGLGHLSTAVAVGDLLLAAVALGGALAASRVVVAR